MLKGGVGKSFYSKHFSVQFKEKLEQQLGRPVKTGICDLDAQGTLARWAKARKDKEIQTPASISTSYEKLPSVIQKAKDIGLDLLWIDTPPSHTEPNAVKAAAKAVLDHNGIIVIPTGMSAEDIEIVPMTIRLLRQVGVDDEFITILNRAKESKAKDRAIKTLSAISHKLGGEYCSRVIYDRVDYVDSGVDAQTAFEYAPRSKAAKEILAAGDEVFEYLNTIRKNKN